MGKNTVAVIIAILLIVAGIAISCAALVMTDFSFDSFATETFEETTHTVDGDFVHILIAAEEHDINVLPSADGECKIVCDESKVQKLEYGLDGDALVIKVVDGREWYEHIGIFSEGAELTLYLPEKSYTSLTAATDTGDITVSEELTFIRSSVATLTGGINFRAKVADSLDLAASTGNITATEQTLISLGATTSTGRIVLENVKAIGRITLETNTGRTELHSVEAGGITSKGTTGDILLKNVYVENDVNIKRSTGDVTLTSVIAGAFEIETSTGDVKLNSSDAENIRIETDTGKVEGTLLTEKIFVTDSSTGNIRVPSTTSGGTCKIRTSTGDIIITIE